MKKYLFIVLFAFVLFSCPTVFADTVTGRASVGRQAVMDTSNNYYYSDWKLLSDNSINALPINAFTSATEFYIMGAEYSFPMSLTGQTNFAVTVRIPVSDNTIYSYTEMDGLNQDDFKVGLHQNFSVYNITPTVTSFQRVKGVLSRNGVAHTFMYYDVVFNFTLQTGLTGAYNLNFAVFNTSGSRSTYYYYGGSPGTTFEFPVAADYGNLPDAVLFYMMSPSVSVSYGTSASNSDIIEANNQNTEMIISNQNENTEALQQTIQESYENLVASQEVCSNVSVNYSFNFSDGYLKSDGSINNDSDWFYTDYLHFSYLSKTDTLGNSPSICFYDSDKVLISCSNNSSIPNGTITFPNNYYYVRLSIQKSSNRPIYSGFLCQNGNQAINDTLTDSSFDSHSTQSFFDNIEFYDESTLSAVITAPIDFINSLDDACTPVVLTYRGQSITLPCGNDIFWDRQDVSSFRALWNALFGGLIIYRLVRKLLQVVNDALDPTKDSLGGLDL